MSSTIAEKNTNIWLYVIPLLLVSVFIRKALSDAVVSLSAIFFIVYVIKYKRVDFLSVPWLRAALLFFAYGVITSFFSPFPQAALTQALIFIRWPLFAAMLYFIAFNNEKNIEIFEKTAVVFLLFIMFDTLLQMIHGTDIFGRTLQEEYHRPTGPFVKLVAGVYSLKVFFFAFVGCYFIFKNKSKAFEIILTAIYALVAVFILSTGERVVFLLMLMGLVLWLGALIYKNPATLRYILPILAISVGGLAVLLSFSSVSVLSRAGSFVDLLSNFPESTYGRIFHAATEVWKTQPITGVGMRMYSETCEILALPDVLNWCNRHPHNIYLEVLAQAGVIGMMLFLYMLFCFFKPLLQKKIWQQDYLLAMVLFTSVLVIFWPIASSMSIFANNYAGPVWLTIAWALSRARFLQLSVDCPKPQLVRDSQ